MQFHKNNDLFDYPVFYCSTCQAKCQFLVMRKNKFKSRIFRKIARGDRFFLFCKTLCSSQIPFLVPMEFVWFFFARFYLVMIFFHSYFVKLVALEFVFWHLWNSCTYNIYVSKYILRVVSK